MIDSTESRARGRAEPGWAWPAGAADAGWQLTPETEMAAAAVTARAEAQSSIDEPLGHLAHRDPPEHEREGDEPGETNRVERLEPEARAADELDQLMQRVELRGDLEALGQARDQKVPATRNSGVIASIIT